MFTARVASEPGGTKISAPQRGKVGVHHHNFFTFTSPQAPCRPPEHLERSVGPRPGRGRPMRYKSMFCNQPTGVREPGRG
eukprot:483905-Prymnesium_polylepis.1